jgi:hypothetical protein
VLHLFIGCFSRFLETKKSQPRCFETKKKYKITTEVLGDDRSGEKREKRYLYIRKKDKITVPSENKKTYERKQTEETEDDSCG